MPLQRKVPAKACRFSADLEVGSNGENAKTAPVTLLARTGDAVDNFYWGRIVHDLAGMSVKPRIPLDYCHEEDEVIGYANNFDTSSGDLVAKGALVPYSADPDDKAAEIIYKAQNDVPYEASIFFAGPMSIEDVSDGVTVNVNGKDFTGPLTVVRQWTLRGIAICPYGVDDGTDTSFKNKYSTGDEVVATVLNVEVIPMAAEAAAAPAVEMSLASEIKEVAGEVKSHVESAIEKVESKIEHKAEAPAVEAKPAEAVKAVEAKAEEVKETVETAVEGTPSVEAKPVETKMSKTGPDYLAAFGDKGGVWFAQSKSFDECQTLYTNELKAERDQLSDKVKELSAQLGANRGEETPASFSAEAVTTPGISQKTAQNLGGGGLAKFAASIKFEK